MLVLVCQPSSSMRMTRQRGTHMTPIRKSLVIPSHVPPAGEPASRPLSTQASSLARSGLSNFENDGPGSIGSKACHSAGVVGRSKYSSLLEARILTRVSDIAGGMESAEKRDRHTVGSLGDPGCRRRYTYLHLLAGLDWKETRQSEVWQSKKVGK